MLSFPITPLNVNPSLMNIKSFTAVRLPDFELELADMANKDMWASKFRSLTADLESHGCQKAILAQSHK